MLLKLQVVCSLCGTDDVVGNDVLLCDRSGCCRAYHQQCLNPPVDISGMICIHDYHQLSLPFFRRFQFASYSLSNVESNNEMQFFLSMIR